jgi:hypothetical protein
MKSTEYQLMYKNWHVTQFMYIANNYLQILFDVINI